MKRIFKYPTGAVIPEGAVYLNTVTQTDVIGPDKILAGKCWLVWHYFLVEVEECSCHTEADSCACKCSNENKSI